MYIYDRLAKIVLLLRNIDLFLLAKQLMFRLSFFGITYIFKKIKYLCVKEKHQTWESRK